MHAGYSFTSPTAMLAIICYNLAMCYCNVKYLLDFVLGWGLSSLRLCTRLIMLWSTPKYGIFLTHMLSIDRSRIVCYSGLLIFRAVAEPRISSKSAKSREIHKNTQNPAKFAKNLTKYMSAQHIWKLFWLLGLLTHCKLTNLPSQTH